MTTQTEIAAEHRPKTGNSCRCPPPVHPWCWTILDANHVGEALSTPLSPLSTPSTPWTRYKRVSVCVCAYACSIVASEGWTPWTPPFSPPCIVSTSPLPAESVSTPGGGQGVDSRCPPRPSPNPGTPSGWFAW